MQSDALWLQLNKIAMDARNEGLAAIERQDLQGTLDALTELEAAEEAISGFDQAQAAYYARNN